METSLWCIDDICRQAPRDFDTRLQIIFGGCAVRNSLFAYHGNCLNVLIEPPAGSLGAAARVRAVLGLEPNQLVYCG
jgi:hypothetical protein